MRGVGWHLHGEADWHKGRGALAKIERCVGNLYHLNVLFESTCATLKFLRVITGVAFSYRIQQATEATYD
jgi:hypothetical protein